MRTYGISGSEKIHQTDLRSMPFTAFHPPASAGYRIAALVNATALTTGAIAANTIYALPFVAPPTARKCAIIGFNVTTLAAGNARIGLYKNKAANDVYPGDLIVDSGSISTGTATVKSYNLPTPFELVPGELYWLVLHADAAPTLRAMAMAGVYPTLGMPTALGTAAQIGWSIATAYAALPNPFTAGAVAITAVPLPALFFSLT